MKVSKPFTFNSRETYLEFRSNWKEEYMQISADIRSLKKTIKFTQRTTGETSFLIYRSLRNSQARANELLEMLAEAKQLAQKQYLEQHKELLDVCN